MPNSVTPAIVLDALRPIIDPDFGKSIVDLGFIKNLKIDGGSVSFAIELTTPACPVKAEFERAGRERVLALEGVTDVRVEMTSQTRASSAAVSASPDVLPGVANVVAVASGKGGVGKSTVALNLALALAGTGARVGLMDADVYGPSVPLLTGVQQRPDAHDQRIECIEKFGLRLMSIGFFVTENSPVIWRGPMVHGLIRQFLTDVDWGPLDYLIVDMPPGTGDAALTLTQQAPLSGAVIVTTANDLSLVDARKGLAMFQKVEVPLRRRRWAANCRRTRGGLPGRNPDRFPHRRGRRRGQTHRSGGSRLGSRAPICRTRGKRRAKAGRARAIGAAHYRRKYHLGDQLTRAPFRTRNHQPRSRSAYNTGTGPIDPDFARKYPYSSNS
jgi:ATP-binding protein involved in chromosome partitioning